MRVLDKPQIEYEVEFNGKGRDLYVYAYRKVVERLSRVRVDNRLLGYEDLDGLYESESKDSRRVGYMYGVYYTLLDQDLDMMECYEDIEALSHSFPQTLTESERIRIVEVRVSSLVPQYRGKGVGADLYLTFIRAQWDEVREPFILIPNYCAEGATSPLARRVWAGLGKRYPHSGSCIAILSRP